MVRYIKSIIIVMVLFFSITVPHNARELFMEGNKSYQAGNISHALQYYNKISDKGAAVWYNIGCCYAALQKYSEALIALKKALHCAPYSLRAQIIDHYNSVGTHSGQAYKRTMHESIGYWLRYTPTLFMQIFYILLWLLLWHFLFRATKRRFFVIGIIIVFNVLLGICLFVKYRDSRYVHAFTVSDVNLKVGPDEQYDVVGSLCKLEDVYILESKQTWSKVASHECTGWLPSNVLETM